MLTFRAKGNRTLISEILNIIRSFNALCNRFNNFQNKRKLWTYVWQKMDNLYIFTWRQWESISWIYLNKNYIKLILLILHHLWSKCCVWGKNFKNIALITHYDDNLAELLYRKFIQIWPNNIIQKLVKHTLKLVETIWLKSNFFFIWANMKTTEPVRQIKNIFFFNFKTYWCKQFGVDILI